MRFFNTAGPCDPSMHYMLPPERRLPEAKVLIDRQLYFVVHAPRQSGKTTLLQTLAQRLTSEERYTALVMSCEAGQAAGGDVEKGIAAVLDSLRLAARSDLPEELRPPPVNPEVPETTRLFDLLSRWSEQSPRPVVLFMDEIDALTDKILNSVLRQIRAGYMYRPQGFPQSVILVGTQDCARFSVGRERWDIKAESLRLPDFTDEQAAELFEQHRASTGQVFSPEARTLLYELTQGQPWLVNALARVVIEELATDRKRPIGTEEVLLAKRALLQRREGPLQELTKEISSPRAQVVLHPLLNGELIPPDLSLEDWDYVIDLGLICKSPSGLKIANPIYQEILA